MWAFKCCVGDDTAAIDFDFKETITGIDAQCWNRGEFNLGIEVGEAIAGITEITNTAG